MRGPGELTAPVMDVVLVATDAVRCVMCEGADAVRATRYQTTTMLD